MWCSLEQCGQITPITWRAVMDHLCPPAAAADDRDGTSSGRNSDDEDEWQADWDAAPSEETVGGTGKAASRRSKLKLAETLIACSPGLDILAFARGQRFVTLGLSPPPGMKSSKHHVDPNSPATQCTIHAQSELGEGITALLCLPIAASQANQSRSALPYDWTALVVGLESGQLRFYTADAHGSFLFRMQLASRKGGSGGSSESVSGSGSGGANERNASGVRSVDLHPAGSFGSYGTGQSLSVLLADGTLVIIDGLSLYTALRAARNQLVLKGMEPDKVAELASGINVTSKWVLNRGADFSAGSPHHMVSDHFGAGHYSPGLTGTDPLTQMTSASILGGFKANLSAQPPDGLLFSVIGGPGAASPFLSFHWAPEEKSPQGLTEFFGNLSTTVKSVVKNQAPSLGSLGTAGASIVGKFLSPKPHEKVPLETMPAWPLELRFLVSDLNRVSSGLYSMPGSQHKAGIFAVTDNRARVCLVEAGSGTILRMWKGMRRAQCGFVSSYGSVESENSDSHLKTKKPCRSAFLTIYAPRNGVLEIHPIFQGPRSGAFNVGYDGKLLQLASERVLGVAAASGVQAAPAFSQVCFLDSQGIIKRVKIPFRLTLQDESSQALHEMSILKEFRRLLAEAKSLNEQNFKALQKLLSELKMADSFKNAFQITQTVVCLEPRHMDMIFELCEKLCAKRSEINKAMSPQAGRRRPSFKRGHSTSGPSTKTDSNASEVDSAAPVDNPFSVLARVFSEYRSLVNLYVTVLSLSTNGENRERDFEISGETQAAELKETLFLDETKLDDYMTALNECMMARPSSIDRLDKRISLQQFLGCFAVDGAKPTHESVALVPNLEADACYALGDFLFRNLIGFGNFAENFAKTMPNLKLSSAEKVKLISSAWLTRPHAYSAYPPHVCKLFRGILSPRELDLNLLDSAATEAIKGSKHLPETLAFAIIIRAVLRGLDTDRTQSSGSNDLDNDDEFELVEQVHEKWDNVLLTLHSILPILSMHYYLTSDPGGGAGGGTAESPAAGACEFCPLINVAALLEHKKGAIVELVACAITAATMVTIPPARVLAVYSGVSDLHASWEVCLGRLIKSFPRSLTPDYLLSSCALKFAQRWDQNADRDDWLRCMVEYLQDISNPVLQHGMCYLIWTTHVTLRFRNLVALLEKIGKFPKDRLCRKELGLTDEKVVDFAMNCSKLLKLMFEANSQYELTSITPSNLIETHLEIFFHNMLGTEELNDGAAAVGHSAIIPQLPLCELALVKKCTNYFLVRHHWQLALVAKMMLESRLKPSRPLTLFDQKGKDAFFLNLHSMPLLPRNSPDELDASTQIARSQFFRRYVSALLSATLPYPPMPEPPENEDRHPVPMPDLSDAAVLAKEWELDTDHLWIHCILELYSIGYDYLAERKMCLVQNRPALGSELLILAGQRLAVRLWGDTHSAPTSTHDSSAQKTKASTGLAGNVVTLLSPTLKTWLKALDTDRLMFKESSLASCKVILRYARSFLPETHAEHTLAAQLSTLLEKFKN